MLARVSVISLTLALNKGCLNLFSNLTKLHNINKSAKKITEKLPLSDRIEKMQETEAYITIKDHKESFPNKIRCRLINPSKSSVGRISKVNLDKINDNIQKKTSVNQWKDTSSVIEWFVNIKEKERSSFMVFDIESFYPSITECLFTNAIRFAKQITEISDYDMSLINQSRKTLLFNERIPWVKKVVVKILMSQWDVLMERRCVN